MDKNILSQIEWVFFDVGGVLVDETAVTVWRQKHQAKVLQQMGVQVTVQDIENRWPQACSQIGSVDLNIFKIFLRDNALADQARAIYKEYKEQLSYVDTVVARVEVVPVLETLSKNYKLGIIANQSAGIKTKLEAAGILKFFDVHTVSDEHGFEKPDPRIFEAVFKETGADSMKSVMIDDNIERGLIPAKKFGMTTVWYKLENREVPLGAVDCTIESLPDLLSIF